jgi:hypothetical protein
MALTTPPTVDEGDADVTVTLPRATFDMVKEFILAMGQAVKAADAHVSALEKSAKAGAAIQNAVAPPQDDLGGFAQELTAASNRGLGM